MSKNPLADAVETGTERERKGADEARGEATGEFEEKRLNANIPKGLHDEFKAVCKRRRVPMSFVIERLVRQYVEEA